MGRVLTLLYHRVNTLKCDRNLLAVSSENFYEQILFIKNSFPVVRFDQGWDDLDEDAVCITFDDGYFDNLTNGLPILKELQIPATIFAVTGTIETGERYWWDELERNLLDGNREYAACFSLKDDMFSCQWPTKTVQEREELYDTLHWLMKDKIDAVKRGDWLKQIREWSGVEKANVGLFKHMEQSWLSPLLTIGAHTVNHFSLKGLSKDDQYYEISASKKALEDLLHQEVTVFSYPFGTLGDYNETTIEICRELGFEKAAANFPGIWARGYDCYQIPRNIVRNWSLDSFKNHIGEFWKMGECNGLHWKTGI